MISEFGAQKSFLTTAVTASFINIHTVTMTSLLL